MNANEKGRAVFYTRDSGGKHEQTPGEYLRWAQKEVAELAIQFDGTPEKIEAMIRTGIAHDGDLFLDYDVCGNVLSRPGLDALLEEVASGTGITHVLIPRRDRLARPNNPLDGMRIEELLRRSGATVVFMDKVCPPLAKGKRGAIGDLIVAMIDYDTAGAFRRELAQKMLLAQISLARNGFSTGGRPPYGFRRWLAKADGTRVRELAEGEVVRQAGHHVVWLPGPEKELEIVRRILEMLETMPASRVARKLTAEGVPTPDAGRYRTDNGVRHQTSGVWHSTTITNIARNPLLLAIASYGRRSMGDQLRFTPDGPRELADSDFHADDSPKVIRNPDGEQIEAAAKFEPIVDPVRQKRLLTELDKRAGTQRGKPQSQDPSKNPLGSRVFDINCSWPMYRVPYGRGFKYKCGLYQQSSGQECDHNHVDGELATRFMLGIVRQGLLTPKALPRLEKRLRELAAADGGKAERGNEAAVKRAEILRVDQELDTVSRNLALAKDQIQHEAISKVFEEILRKKTKLQAELSAIQSAERAKGNQEEEIAKVLGVIERLPELAENADTLEAARELFQLANARLFLRFKQVQVKKRRLNKVAGGVVTLGDADPPISIYEGPTGRRKLKESRAAGEDSVASDRCESGQEGKSLGNVSRGDWQSFEPLIGSFIGAVLSVESGPGVSRLVG